MYWVVSVSLSVQSVCAPSDQTFTFSLDLEYTSRGPCPNPPDIFRLVHLGLTIEEALPHTQTDLWKAGGWPSLNSSLNHGDKTKVCSAMYR